MSRLILIGLFGLISIFPLSSLAAANSAKLMMHIFHLHSINKKVTDKDCKAAYQGQSDAPPLISQKNGELIMGSFKFWGGTEKQTMLGNDLILVKGHSNEVGLLKNKKIHGTLYWAGVRSSKGGKFEGGAFADGWCAGNYTVTVSSRQDVR